MFVAAALCSCVCVVAGAQDVPAYRDAKLPVEDRVADLIGRMTLDEKVAQLEGTGEIKTITCAFESLSKGNLTEFTAGVFQWPRNDAVFT
jgi:hypothetical protein